MNNNEGRDEIRHFFKECHQITSEAQFLVNSLPHAETEAVERATRQLNAVRVTLVALNDPHSTAEQIEHLAHYVDSLIRPLELFLDQPPPPARAHIPCHHTNKPGRPTYSLDMNRAHLLHDLGNTWDDVAKAMGVARSTIYKHLKDHGLSSARKE
ncbi:hypothetical protein C8J57DRAFT_534716 [Mycena rebaudengoi]|nr:hypothetical protein C8J57DRAFT_534716 [Mycena rebaudengoi]